MKFRRFLCRGAVLFLLAALLCGLASSCTRNRPDPKNPVTITVWHYYNGAIMSAFENMVKAFNDTVGAKEGIIVEGYGYGGIPELESAVMASLQGDVGSAAPPHIFASYADTAYAAECMGLLADLGQYLSAEEQAAYLPSFIEEGKIGLGGELRIFPIAKSTETMMLNVTDWEPFAEAYNLGYDDLGSIEKLTATAKLYYEWTDAATPLVPHDGKAFYGRDSIANMFILSSKEFGIELFSVTNGEAVMQADEAVMRALWEHYYIPYISGYFSSYGKYRSDDAKVGDILAYVGSTTSAAYFPKEVTRDGVTYPISSCVLPAPGFEGGSKVMVQQGAGMVVTKGDPVEEYAAVRFLKWFTETENNVEFAALSGYLPVKSEAMDYSLLSAELDELGVRPDDIARETLRVALDGIRESELYTNKAFAGGAKARTVLDNSLQGKAVADREQVKAMLADGLELEEAVAALATEEAFQQWLGELRAALEEAKG